MLIVLSGNPSLERNRYTESIPNSSFMTFYVHTFSGIVSTEHCEKRPMHLMPEGYFDNFTRGSNLQRAHTKLWLPSGFVSGVGGAGRGASLAEGIDVAAVEDSTDDSSVNQSSYMNQNTQAKENTKWYM